VRPNAGILELHTTAGGPGEITIAGRTVSDQARDGDTRTEMQKQQSISDLG
jgi:hypothetical protein